MLQLSQIDDEIRGGMAGRMPAGSSRPRSGITTTIKGHPSSSADRGAGARFRESGQAQYQAALHRVVNKLASGLYGRGGPGRRVVNSAGADAFYQAAIGELRLDRYMHKIDQLTWLHGYSALQVVPNLDPDRGAGCPVILRPWRADQLYAWLDDNGLIPEAVLIRSTFARRKQIRFQVWSPRSSGRTGRDPGTSTSPAPGRTGSIGMSRNWARIP